VDKTSVQQVADADAAIGVAVSYIASRPPFGSYRADRLVGSIAGQVKRRHYAFAVRNGAVVGYVGWALCEPEVARAWIESGQPPAWDQCHQGDVVVPIVIIADDRQALRQLVTFFRKRYGGKTYLGRRASREVNFVRRGRVGLSR
jgi:hemolysin-activating ACP:hemolysin acyltransferase